MDAQLFLGIELSSIEGELEVVSPSLKGLYFGSSADSLREIESEGKVYLGRIIGEMVNLPDLHLMYNHIQSIFKRLLPDRAQFALSVFPVRVNQ